MVNLIQMILSYCTPAKRYQTNAHHFCMSITPGKKAYSSQKGTRILLEIVLLTEQRKSFVEFYEEFYQWLNILQKSV